MMNFKEVLMKVISVSVPDELKKELENIAEKEMCSVASVARRAIQYYVDSRQPVSAGKEEK